MGAPASRAGRLTSGPRNYLCRNAVTPRRVFPDHLITCQNGPFSLSLAGVNCSFVWANRLELSGMGSTDRSVAIPASLVLLPLGSAWPHALAPAAARQLEDHLAVHGHRHLRWLAPLLQLSLYEDEEARRGT